MDDISNHKIRKLVFQKYNGRCAYCGDKLKQTFTIDHISPKLRYDKSVGGPDKLVNYNPCCASCNASKWSYSLEEWRKKLNDKVRQAKRESSSLRTAIRFGIIKETGITVKFYFEKYHGQ